MPADFQKSHLIIVNDIPYPGVQGLAFGKQNLPELFLDPSLFVPHAPYGEHGVDRHISTKVLDKLDLFGRGRQSGGDIGGTVVDNEMVGEPPQHLFEFGRGGSRNGGKGRAPETAETKKTVGKRLARLAAQATGSNIQKGESPGYGPFIRKGRGVKHAFV